ncbi:MAG: alpha/beta hydrolase [Actinomycetota bacterium]
MANPTPAESLTITTADGVTLEAALDDGTEDGAEPTVVAVVCHPHPLYGGDMHNPVVRAVAAAVTGAGGVAMRFNFRGVGGSGGQHGEGRAERHDVSAAVTALAARHPEPPLLLAGYSFGGDVSLSVTDDGIAGWLAVAPPMRILPVEELAAGPDARPVRIVAGSADEFRPPDQLRPLVEDWVNLLLTEAAGATHFFMLGLDTVRSVAADLVRELAS